jgi:alkanesulfonate monooxygenase SsuD/methylene tetrahydromethanopterin reductase-like flavin-dependent oxidoreductase (luciferase family)
MKFGIFDHLDRREGPLTAFFEERLQLVEAADRLGIAGYHIAEHHWNPVGMAPRPGVFLGAAASRTRRIRLGPLAYPLAFYNPLMLAEEVCMLDHLSGGRLELGVGRGISPWEIALYGLALPATRDLFRESLEIMLQAFTSDVLTYRGTTYTYHDVPMELRPLQAPYPPLWYGASSGQTRDYLAGLGAAMVAGWGPSAHIRHAVEAYREAWERNSDAPRRAHVPAEPVLGSVRQVVIADTDSEAEAIARPARDRWHKSLDALSVRFGFRSAFLPPEYDTARRAESIIAGTAATVRDALARHIRESGVNYVMLQVAFGSLSHAESLRTLEQFAAEVMPHLGAPANAHA